ncbi:MAG TPA: Ltp family lipoprotein [Acidimicrobiales bacterium]|nr:Ltp family lipoprotein [Acidimicrobiales bacterium]
MAGACASGTDAKVDSATKAPAKHEAPATTEAPTTEAPTTAPPTTEAPKPKPPPENPELTNAKRSAQSYVDMSGFSRQGLIDQLSSEYGEKFPVAIATAAVDSLTVDWNQEAVESAKSYVEMSGFSRQGLIDQLSSKYGDKFTVQQATYGADKALAG